MASITNDVYQAKSDHQRALMKVEFAKQEVAKARQEVQATKAEYQRALAEQRDHWEIEFALNDIRVAERKEDMTLQRLETAHMLKSSRARTLQRAQQAPTNLKHPCVMASCRSSRPVEENPWNHHRDAHQRETSDRWEIQRRKQSASHYKRYSKSQSQVRCCVTEIWGGAKTVVSASLLPIHTTSPNLQTLWQMKGKLHDMRNTLPLLKTIQQAYSTQRLCFVMNPDDVAKDYYRIHLLDASLEQEKVHGLETFQDLETRTFDLPVGRDGKRPWARCLSFHAQSSYSRAVRMGWVDRWAIPPVLQYGSPLGTDMISFSSETESESDSCVSDIED